ncbi:MAG: Altronate dehydratase [Firmicutes bacterium ADurb.Bin153]|nr:MAG: Altronate dehydratase [Firmicutes bacterium ADurb.Bin153]
MGKRKIEKQFMGYLRADGTVGIRNHVLVLPSVICSSHTSRKIAQGIKGAVALYNEHGCGHIGRDYHRTLRTMVGMGTNPNVHSVLVVGLGCEQVIPSELAEVIGKSGKRVEVLVIQDEHGIRNTIRKGRQILRSLVEEASKAARVPVPADRLVVGTECGGSDAMSGVSANPSIGAAVDLIVGAGGKAILSETPEFIGAEHVLARRGAADNVGVEILRIVRAVEDLAISAGEDIRGAQPSPGNMTGGLTTIEEKSLGCIHKGGTREVNAAYDYAERVQCAGLSIMDTTGDDIRSVSGMVAGGAQIVLFSTGRGTPAGCAIAPVIKISSNSRAYENMRDCIDINAGTVVEGSETIELVGERIYDFMIKVASGRRTKSEILGQDDFAIDRLLPTI